MPIWMQQVRRSHPASAPTSLKVLVSICLTVLKATTSPSLGCHSCHCSHFSAASACFASEDPNGHSWTDRLDRDGEIDHRKTVRGGRRPRLRRRCERSHV